MLYARSCERPSKSSARVFLPSSVSNSYCFSTGTHGSSSRFLLISPFRSACSASSFPSSSRAACHSSRVPVLCSGMSPPSFGRDRSGCARICRRSDASASPMRPPASLKLIGRLRCCRSTCQALSAMSARNDPRSLPDTWIVRRSLGNELRRDLGSVRETPSQPAPSRCSDSNVGGSSGGRDGS
jgi:hypothetical protein